jgi:hypothetical protein
MSPDPLLQRIVPALAEVPGVAAIALGGSRARGTATETSDYEGRLAQLKAAASPYPRALREALIRKFDWEILFAIENAELAAARAEQTHVAGCAHRALACAAQVLFALNERYLINEKGALQEAATLPLAIPDIAERANDIWRLIGDGEFDPAIAALRDIAGQVNQLTGKVVQRG